MENKAHYALIGTFVLIALLAVGVFTAWLSNSQWDQTYDKYEVVFDGAVRGLTRGSEVRYNGLKVGEVTSLRWDREDNDTVIAEIQVAENTPVHVESIAQLEPLGLTGLNYVQIAPGPSGEAFRGRGPFQIKGKMSQIDSLLGGGEDIVTGIQRALTGVNATLSKESIDDFQSILKNLSEITAKIKEADVDGALIEDVLRAFEQSAKDISKAALAIDGAGQAFDDVMTNEFASMIKRIETSLDQVDSMTTNIATFAEGGTALTTDARDAINRLSNSGLTDMEETADGIRRLIGALNSIVEQIEQNPAAFIAGSNREVVELPQ